MAALDNFHCVDQIFSNAAPLDEARLISVYNGRNDRLKLLGYRFWRGAGNQETCISRSKGERKSKKKNQEEQKPWSLMYGNKRKQRKVKTEREKINVRKRQPHVRTVEREEDPLQGKAQRKAIAEAVDSAKMQG